MGWTFFFLMVVLKLPIVALLYIVWRAINDVDDPAEQAAVGEDGGSKTPPRPGTPGSPRVPRRRGPHGEPPLAPPPRSRTPAVARQRTGSND